jgi:hypothetical protein
MNMNISEDVFLELAYNRVVLSYIEKGKTLPEAEDIICNQSEVDHFYDILNQLDAAHAQKYFEAININLKICDITKIKQGRMRFKGDGNYCGIESGINKTPFKAPTFKCKSVPTLLRFLRSDQTLNDFGKIVKIDAANISKVEKGKANFSNQKLIKIAGLAGYQLDITTSYHLRKI